jgi:Ser/Thr protein kinase RdoA (MazF antagonist)
LRRWNASRVTNLARFRTGNQHFVYDVKFEDGRQAVIRLSRPEEQEAMAGALRWNRVLRPLAVRLPEILFFDLEAEFPFLILERLPGEDLGGVIDYLSEPELRKIATEQRPTESEE